MNIIDIHNQSGLPNFLFSQPPCVSNFPYVVEISDLWAKTGSGIGTAIDSAHAAMGEYFERRHFYMEIYPSFRCALSKALHPEEVQLFCDAFDQTVVPALATTNLTTHIFNMTKVHRLSDFSECFIPTVTLSINNQNGSDDGIYPVKDTCGCSFHQHSEKAMFGSIRESLERQFLTRFWLTKKCVRTYDSLQIAKHLQNSLALPLFRCLGQAGNVKAIDITDERFPGVCVLIVYGSANSSRTVQYCAGMAYAETLSKALEKSILELWQTYRFINLFKNLGKEPDNDLDPYLHHFLNSNHVNTYHEIVDTVEHSAKQYRNPKIYSFSLHGLTQTLKALSLEGYFYTKKIQYQDTYYTFSKFISPSLFMHMNNSQHFNLKNEYSADFSDKIIHTRLTRMVPFP
jgi:hypothetical protein